MHASLLDLATDELQEITPNEKLSSDAANAIIMAARAHWFADEDAAKAEAEEAEGTEDATDEAPSGDVEK